MNLFRFDLVLTQPNRCRVDCPGILAPTAGDAIRQATETAKANGLERPRIRDFKRHANPVHHEAAS